MDLNKLKISAEFIGERAPLSWSEARFGIVNELLDPSAAIDLAAEQVAVLEDRPTFLLNSLAPRRTNRRKASLTNSPTANRRLRRKRSATSGST